MDNWFISPHLDRLIDLALEEDIGPGDITTQAIIDPELQGEAHIRAKAALVVAGLPVRPGFFVSWTRKSSLPPAVDDGQEVAPGTVLARLTGPVASILTGERVALNFLQRLSGIATLTRAMAAQVAGPTRFWWTPARPPRAGGSWRNTPFAWAAATITAWDSMTRCSSRTIT